MEELFVNLFTLVCCASMVIFPLVTVGAAVVLVKRHFDSNPGGGSGEGPSLSPSKASAKPEVTPRELQRSARPSPKPPKQSKHPKKLGGKSHFDRYRANYYRAEKLRKKGQGAEAIPYYEYAIEELEKDGTTKEFGPPPGPYGAFGKLLYHMGYQKRLWLSLTGSQS